MVAELDQHDLVPHGVPQQAGTPQENQRILGSSSYLGRLGGVGAGHCAKRQPEENLQRRFMSLILLPHEFRNYKQVKIFLKFISPNKTDILQKMTINALGS